MNKNFKNMILKLKLNPKRLLLVEAKNLKVAKHVRKMKLGGGFSLYPIPILSNPILPKKTQFC